jgi:aldehyde dehydrogenase (NAD+)
LTSICRLEIYNPKDGSLVANDIALAGEHDVDAAVAAAEQAFPVWKKLRATARRDIMIKFADLLVQHEVALAELTRLTLGAPYSSFGKFETGLAADVFKYKNTQSAVSIRIDASIVRYRYFRY